MEAFKRYRILVEYAKFNLQCYVCQSAQPGRLELHFTPKCFPCSDVRSKGDVYVMRQRFLTTAVSDHACLPTPTGTT
jgi:hypothetical protein